MLRAVSQVVREVEKRERVARKRRCAAAVASRGEGPRVLPENSCPGCRVVKPARGPGRVRPRRRLTREPARHLGFYELGWVLLDPLHTGGEELLVRVQLRGEL